MPKKLITKKTRKCPEQRRKDIIQAAEELFLTPNKGYYGTSIEEITQKLGVSKATVFYHFKTKKDILKEIINSELKRISELTRNILLKDVSAVEKIQLTMDSYFAEELPLSQKYGPLFLETAYEMRWDETIEELISQGTFIPFWKMIIRQGVVDKEFSLTDDEIRIAPYIIHRAFMGSTQLLSDGLTHDDIRYGVILPVLTRFFKLPKGTLH